MKRDKSTLKEYYYDVFLHKWRNTRYYDRYKEKISKIEGVWLHDCFGNIKRIKSIMFENDMI